MSSLDAVSSVVKQFEARPPAPERDRAGRRLLSLVIPCYNESANIEPLFARLFAVLDTLPMDWEVVCVNDGSKDDTLERLTAVHAREPRVRVVDLSRNFGKEAALSAGLSIADGDAVIPMDADLQHPPELLPDLVAKWREGFDVVIAIREARTGQSTGNRLGARMFYWLFDRMSEVPLPREAGDFRLLDRVVVDVINRMPERTRFMKGIFAWVGFSQTTVPFFQGERASGETKWGFLKLLRFSMVGLTAFSTFPLRVWGLIGGAISALAFCYIVLRLLRTAFYGIDVPGYESIIVTVLFLGGVQLLTLGIIGDYLGRVFDEVKGRPLYIVRSIHGRAAPAPLAHEAETRRGADLSAARRGEA
ncbi:glycosyltransferase family 2 protein [Skermanella stibiiresistens]|uniref:glycosyltransferase family 2 protein n=1 Tax=Skermanella stibiiresistens TaxID=913326 RepID=UPI0007C6FAA9|nr:glycosyltransferase family 2 protein [Skermanella stibiiresistens]